MEIRQGTGICEKFHKGETGDPKPFYCDTVNFLLSVLMNIILRKGMHISNVWYKIHVVINGDPDSYSGISF